MNLRICLVLAFAVPAAQTRAESAAERRPQVEEDARRLTGDWWGARSDLRDSGVEATLDYTSEVIANLEGGIEEGATLLGMATLLLNVDLEALGWGGGSGRLHILGTHGADPSAELLIGDAQVVSNIEAPNTVTVFEAWLEQELDTASLRAGLIAVDSEFQLVPDAALFVNSSFGVVAALGASGDNGPAIFPVGSLGGRFDVRPFNELVARFALVDGVPGAPDRPRAFDPAVQKDDGWFGIGEVAWESEDAASCYDRRKLALGAYGYTKTREDPTGGGERRGPIGGYVVGQQRIYCEQDPEQGLTVFGQVDRADGRINLFDLYLSGGLVWTGPFRERDADQLGLAVAGARFGAGERASQAADGLDDWEVVVEATYGAEVMPWLMLQPDLQWVTNPGGDPERGDAVVLGGRIVLSL